MNSKPLAGKVAIVTGASRGLGKAMALSLADEGANIALVARDEAALSEVARQMKERNGTGEILVCDVTDEAAVSDLIQKIVSRFGRLHILINNAGVNNRKPITDFSLSEWETVIRTNLTSAFLMCRASVPYMRGHGYGRIVNMTSMMSHVALPGRTAYAASKAGLLGFTKALALELAPQKITVNGISPGPIATAMNASIIENPHTNQQFVSKLPIGRWGKESEVASLALYLCSEAAGFVTGTDFVIDGGWTAQ